MCRGGSPTQALTGPGVEQLHWSTPVHYHWPKPATKGWVGRLEAGSSRAADSDYDSVQAQVDWLRCDQNCLQDFVLRVILVHHGCTACYFSATCLYCVLFLLLVWTLVSCCLQCYFHTYKRNFKPAVEIPAIYSRPWVWSAADLTTTACHFLPCLSSRQVHSPQVSGQAQVSRQRTE